jgi:hypothetical protein
MAGLTRAIQYSRDSWVSGAEIPVIASEAKQSSFTTLGILDCFVAPAQNCFAILSQAPRNDAVSQAHLPAALVAPGFCLIMSLEK